MRLDTLAVTSSGPTYLTLMYFGPSRVRALPLAAGRNKGGHYFRYFGQSKVHALPLASGIKVGGHYFRYFFSLLFFFFAKLSLSSG